MPFWSVPPVEYIVACYACGPTSSGSVGPVWGGAPLRTLIPMSVSRSMVSRIRSKEGFG